MSKTNRFTTPRHTLRLPLGTETMQLHEAARHRRITRILEDRFEGWGYTPVETPLVDYVEIYRPLLSEASMRDTYRTVDRQGEILAVRSDITLFLAKQLGLHLCAEELPVRVWYSDQIVRAEAEDEIARNEYQQAGLELVGLTGIEAEAEVILILQETLAALGLEDAVIHLGTHRVVAAVAGEHGIGDDRTALMDLIDHIRHRRPVVEGRGFTAHEEELLRFIGSIGAFRKNLKRWDLSAAVRGAAQELVDLGDLLDERPAIRIDTSELGAHDYYTGISFGAYHHGSTAAIARGGRYDSLLGYFGFDAPSVGFSMFTRKLPRSVQSTNGRESVAAAGETFRDRVAAARGAHRAGARVHL